MGNKDATALIQSIPTLKGEAQDKALMVLAKHYDFRTLYNMLADIKKSKPRLALIYTAFDFKLPADTIGLLASHVRFKRPDAGADGKFKDDKTYYSKRFANQRKDQCYKGGDKCLFPFVILSVK